MLCALDLYLCALQEVILRVRDLKRQLNVLQRQEVDFIQTQQRRMNRARRFRRFRERRWLRRWLNNENVR